MIRKLRARFVAIAMLSLCIVLVLIIGTVNILNYHSVRTDADLTLDLLVENDGRFPMRNDKFGPGKFVPEHMDLSPELPYQSRFFSVSISDDGSIVSADLESIAAIDESKARDMALEAMEKRHDRGFIGNYRYAVLRSAGETQLIFLDCTNGLSTFRTFLLQSCCISAAGLLAVFILILLLSGRIIRPIAESYEKQKRFITDAGHEIKTPITIIDADTEVLEMELADNEWLQDIRQQTKRLASLTNDLIYLSRMDEAQTQLQLIDFPFSDLVAETAQSFQSLAKAQGKTFDVQITPMLTMSGEEKSLRQLVSVLLDNALKYTPEGGHIGLNLQKSGKLLRLAVENTAEQLEKGDLDRLFDRFYRTDQSRNAKTGGYGLGLSIAKAVVTAHKGRISASSPDGRSLTIEVLLPSQQR